MTFPLLEIRRLNIDFPASPGKRVPAIREVSFEVAAGQRFALVGESGAGKSLIALTILGLLPESAGVAAERVRCCGREILAMPRPAWLHYRREDVAVIWQNPLASFVPVYRIGTQLDWILAAHGIRSHADRTAEARRRLREVEIEDPEALLRRYPGEVSGGECQRVLIAAALIGERKLLIADEPTSALDVLTQAAILRLLLRVADERRLAMLLITHDLSVAAGMCSHVAVLRRGQIVETGTSSDVFRHPRDPYTQALVASLPGPLLADDRASQRTAVP